LYDCVFNALPAHAKMDIVKKRPWLCTEMGKSDLWTMAVLWVKGKWGARMIDIELATTECSESKR